MPPPLQVNVPPPPPAIGATRNAPLNIGMGTVGAVGINAAVMTQFGQEVNEVAFGINLLFQWFKQFPIFNQNFWWPLALLVLGITLFILLETWQGTLEWATAVKHGFASAFTAALNYHSMRVAGINILPPAARRQELDVGTVDRPIQQPTSPLAATQQDQMVEDSSPASDQLGNVPGPIQDSVSNSE